MSDTEYRFTVRPLSGDEGGGYLIEFADLPGWMSVSRATLSKQLACPGAATVIEFL